MVDGGVWAGGEAAQLSAAGGSGGCQRPGHVPGRGVVPERSEERGDASTAGGQGRGRDGGVEPPEMDRAAAVARVELRKGEKRRMGHPGDGLGFITFGDANAALCSCIFRPCIRRICSASIIHARTK